MFRTDNKPINDKVDVNADFKWHITFMNHLDSYPCNSPPSLEFLRNFHYFIDLLLDFCLFITPRGIASGGGGGGLGDSSVKQG